MALGLCDGGFGLFAMALWLLFLAQSGKGRPCAKPSVAAIFQSALRNVGALLLLVMAQKVAMQRLVLAQVFFLKAWR